MAHALNSVIARRELHAGASLSSEMLARLHRIGVRTHGDLFSMSEEGLAQELAISEQEAADLMQRVQSSQAS